VGPADDDRPQDGQSLAETDQTFAPRLHLTHFEGYCTYDSKGGVCSFRRTSRPSSYGARCRRPAGSRSGGITGSAQDHWRADHLARFGGGGDIRFGHGGRIAFPARRAEFSFELVES